MKEKHLMNLIGNLEVVKKGENNRIIAGYGNIAMVDSQNQLIPLETLKAGLQTLLVDISYANLMLSHQNIQVGKILPKWGKLTTHVDDKGMYILGKIREDIEIANELWDKILKGKINGFSIGCEVLSEPREVCDANGCVTYLDKINILEVSVCDRPVNKLSGFTIISKSDSISNAVCESCNIKIDKEIMTEKQEVKEEPKEEQKELSVEERLEAMERSIFNIQAAITKMGELQMAEEKSAKMPEEEKKTEEPIPPVEEKKTEEVPDKKEEHVEEMLSKKDFDEFKKSIEDLVSKSIASILESLKPKEQEQKLKSELELSIKARDEQIETLKKHIETISEKEHIDTITKAEANSEPKTVQDNTNKEEQIILEDDCPIVVTRGEVTSRKFVKI